MNLISNKLMTIIIALLTASGIMTSAYGAHGQTPTAPFISVIPDLPVMAGLTEETSDAVVFETEAGRIAQASASGSVEQAKVYDFYAAALPQLGWHLEARDRYQREGEVLVLEIRKTEGQSGQIVVHFKLAPAAP